VLYVIADTKENGSYFHRLHSLDLSTGAEVNGAPIEIRASVLGTGAGSVNGLVSFDPLHSLQRAGLLISNGNVYLGWVTSELHGWVMAYNEQTLAQTAVFNTTPNSVLGGVWQSGAGLAADEYGNIYFATGDATFDAMNDGSDYGDTLLKMSRDLQVLDYFTPMDQICRLSWNQDFGGGGPMLLPSQSGSSVAHEIIISGKGGWTSDSTPPCDSFAGVSASPIYVIDRDQMGGYNPAQDQIVQEVAGAGFGYHSSSAYYQSSGAAYIYYGGLVKLGLGDTLKSWSLQNGLLTAGFSSQTINRFTTGVTPSVSSSGTTNGVVWAIEHPDSFGATPGDSPAILHAYDAMDLNDHLYASDQAGLRDQAGSNVKFQTATVGLGKVYVGTQGEVDVYGLLGKQTATATVLASNIVASSVGEPVTFTAAVNSNGVRVEGYITFKDGTVAMGTSQLQQGKAYITTSTLVKGEHTINAFYMGTGTLAVSYSSVTHTVK
jgi:hypothetical protein